jgi:hypothetical protein
MTKSVAGVEIQSHGLCLQKMPGVGQIKNI